MALFQNSVRKKYLAAQDNLPIKEAFEAYRAYFHNPRIHGNIRASKEEQFQEGFLRELFVNILGYTINPNPDYNLTTELKNTKDAKKTDGAILRDGNALAVIELKGTDTKDLEKVRDQAFNYKNNQPECRYVITSNFEKLRFYIDNAVDFVEFNVFGMQLEDFQLFWLLLQKDNLLRDLPKKLKEESLLVEEQITKQLYADYSSFKQQLWQDMVAKNPGQDELELYKKSQKLLDRFLFIFFAEDKGLLPPNSIMEIVGQWHKLRELDEYRPLYDRFKKYFGYLNTGRVQPGKAEIHAYNGGLFAPDPVLEALKISDEVLEKHVKKLTEYDFESEVDTNILGHIFEHSLNDIENVRAQLAGEEVDKSKTKRKRDGVFYTPKYITKYIVDNTLGRLCMEKKEELALIDEEFAEGKRGRQKKTIQKLKEKLDTYRVWLLQLTICDPACGSGAFLNQVLEFLMAEHRYVDELESQLFDSPLVLPNVENHILENNIFGVDINEESVEIARLSLWLRTAKKGRKLSSLNSNIKVGNSLIDDPAVSGDLAFNWQEEFPQVFAKGGFDVVVGNPPYVRQELFGEIKPYLEKKYKVFEGTSDLFAYFYEVAFKILRKDSLFGFISNTFDKTKAAKKLREFLNSETEFVELIDFTEVQIFEGATTYPIILISRNRRFDETEFIYKKVPKKLQGSVIDIDLLGGLVVIQSSLSSDSWSFISKELFEIFEKIKMNKTVREVFGKCFRGIVTGYNDAFIINGVTKERLESEDSSSKELIKSFFEGKDQSKWVSEDIDKYLIFTRRGTDITNYPSIEGYLNQFKDRLTPRNSEDQKMGRKPGPYRWFEIQDSVDYYKLFESPKITWPNLQSQPKFSIDFKGYYINAPSVILPSSNLTLLCIINSKLIWAYLKSICVVRSGGYIEVKPQYFEQIPIPELKNEEQFDAFANLVINATESNQKVLSNFLNLIQKKYSIEKPSTKLQNWPSLDFKGFLAELKKAKVKLSLSEEAEWMAYFNEQKAKAQDLQAEITSIDQEIDRLVYELYGLTEEEIRIVESN
ncbi:TaqI-like C-terminal specificity domain-containing protein [Cyclobacterium lianum]|uniref:site-specific DNA-methyltransferase (adenine-specific) n=1 Tax=Cyclobacterium lianum TaxID=388280 RepID=A0A1M7LMF4_9BACT|nr:DNA methyltransferase [Cyclobacterium lianum]SHM79332.1 TaqI-like C-terminal specificity domain-containing protein [Cyclobacterium lianum]